MGDYKKNAKKKKMNSNSTRKSMTAADITARFREDRQRRASLSGKTEAASENKPNSIMSSLFRPSPEARAGKLRVNQNMLP